MKNLIYSNAPSLLPFLPFRVSSLLWTYPTPSATDSLPALLGSPTFMRYLFPARNSILPRVSLVVRIVINPNKMTGFSIFDRLANTTRVTRLNYGSLQDRNSLNSARFVYLPYIRGTLTRTTNLVTWLFHPLGNLIYIWTHASWRTELHELRISLWQRLF